MGVTSKRILKGGVANALQLASTTLEQLLLVPILLSNWSVHLYGEWILLSAVPVYFALSDLGFIAAGSNELARRASVEPANKARKFFSDYLSAYLSLSLILFALVTVIGWYAPLDRWLGLDVLGREEASILFIILMAAAVLSQILRALHAGLRARGAYHVGFMIQALTSLFILPTTFVAVRYFNAGPVVVAVIILASRAVQGIFQIIALRVFNFAPSVRLFRSGSERMTPYLSMGMEFMLFPLAQAIILQGMVVLVGSTIGVAAAAIFSTHRTLTRLVSRVQQLAVAPLRAEAGLMQGEAMKTDLRNIFLKVSRASFWVTLITSTSLLLVGSWAYETWTKGKIEFLPTLFSFLILSTVLEGTWQVAGAIRMGTNKHRILAWSYLLFSGLGITLAYPIAKQAGLEFVALPLSLIDFAMCILTVSVTLPMLDIRFRTHLCNVLTPPLHELMGLRGWLKRMSFG